METLMLVSIIVTGGQGSVVYEVLVTYWLCPCRAAQTCMQAVGMPCRIQVDMRIQKVSGCYATRLGVVGDCCCLC